MGKSSPPSSLQKLWWHDTQVMPDPKLSIGDSTVHSVSVVVVVSVLQGENHFQSHLNTDMSVLPCTVTTIGGLVGFTDLEE